MKYIKLFEDFEPHDPYELMIIPPNKKAEMLVREIRESNPNLNLVQDLIVLGANLDWRDEDNSNRTPLHVAAIYGNEEIARMLIDAGSDLNVQDKNECTPLHKSVIWGRWEIVRMLIDAGSDLNVQDKIGRTPLHEAAYEGNVEIAQMLIDAGARKDITNDREELPYDLTSKQEMKNILRP